MGNLDTPARKTTGRSILAVVVGFIVIFILHAGIDAIMHGTGIFPPMGKPMANSLWALALGYRTVTSVFGCYVTARLAPNRPVWHALIVGWIGVVLSLAGAIFTWNKGAEFGPKWYPISLVIVALPCAWIGGKLREQQLKQS
jgi:hypothetical protein